MRLDKSQSFLQALDFFELDIKRLNDCPYHCERKSDVYGLYSRQSGKLICSYSSLDSIYDFLMGRIHD